MRINKQKSGFTLVEMIVYIGIFAVAMTALTIFVMFLLTTKNQTRVSRLTYEEARFILERVNNRIRYAPGIDSGNSVFNESPGTLVLKSPVSASNLTTIALDASGNIIEKVGDNDPTTLNSQDVEVTSLIFKQIISSDTESTIETAVSIRYRDLGRPDLSANTTLASQASLRNDYAYAWEQTDWSGGSGQLVWSNPTMYSSNPDANADTQSCLGDARLGTNNSEIVIHTSNVCDFHGNFHLQGDATAADGLHAEDMPNLGLRVGGHFGNAAESSPTHYFDASFKAQAGKLYHLWARIAVAADNDFGTSDSMYIQFSDALENGDPVNRMGTSQGLVVSKSNKTWEWDDIWEGTENTGEIMSFEHTGDHTFRVQRREDGAMIDQILLSSSTYFNAPPSNGAIIPLKYASTAALLSSKFDTGDATVFGQLSWSSFTPAGTTLSVQLRSADTEAGLDAAPWYGPTGQADSYTVSHVGVNSIHDGDRWVQYAAVLATNNPTQTPILNSIKLSYSN